MTALLFPGQGSQTKGMIKDFYDNSAKKKPLTKRGKQNTFSFVL